MFRFASDEVLVARVRSGSVPAFEALFRRHHRALHAFCRHMLGSSADAEDAVQHTFMAAYADLMRSDRPIALRPWLYTIARHRCVSVLRERRERPVAELPEPQGDDLATALDSREELRATLADIAHLPEDQRAALVLAELGDASHAEIAQILGCRQEKVKALVFQARSTLATGRTARDTPCAEIREQLAQGGVAMRRTSLRRHVRDCDGCREFGEQLRVRRRLRILFPVAPGLGFKRALVGLLPAAGGGGAAAGAGGLAATAIVTVAIAGGGGDASAAPPAAAEARPATTETATVMPASRTRRHAARAARPERTSPAMRSGPAQLLARGPRAIAPPRPAPSDATPAPVRATGEPGQPGGSTAEAPTPAGPPDERPRPEPQGKPPVPPGKPAGPPGKPPVPPGKPATPPGKPPAPPGKPAGLLAPHAETPGKPAELRAPSEPPGRPPAPATSSGKAAGPPTEPPGQPTVPSGVRAAALPTDEQARGRAEDAGPQSRRS